LATATLPLTPAPFFMQAYAGDTDIYYSAADFRRFLTAVKRRPGILGSVDFAVQQADVVGWAIKVSVGYAHLYGVAGSYLVQLTESTNISVAAFDTAPIAARTHKVFLAVYDKLISGDIYQGQVVVTEDVDGGGAPNPSGAVAFLLLATFTITKSQSNIQNKDIKNVAQHGGSSGAYTPLSSMLLGASYESADAVTGTAEARAIYHDGYVRLSGSIRRVGGGVFDTGSSHTLGALITALRPKSQVVLTCGVDSGSYTARLQIAPDGTFVVRIPPKIGTTSYTQPTIIHLDGCTYDLD
jgi:hypothetical protein